MTHSHHCKHCHSTWSCTKDVVHVLWVDPVTHKPQLICTHDPDVYEPRNHGCEEQTAYSLRMAIAISKSNKMCKVCGQSSCNHVQTKSGWYKIHQYGKTVNSKGEKVAHLQKRDPHPRHGYRR